MSLEHSKPRGLSVHGGVSLRVLIVDDNRDLVEALSAVLESVVTETGVVSVTTAESGKEALVVAERDGFDVAIVDVQLPDTSGVELIAPLRERAPASEVILITGFATVDAAIGAGLLPQKACATRELKLHGYIDANRHLDDTPLTLYGSDAAAIELKLRGQGTPVWGAPGT